MPLTGVAGWPIAHSRSPALHEAAFASLGLEGWTSQLLPIPVELFTETVRALPASGFVGINVTIPHKVDALALADEAGPDARAIGAANTLSFSVNGTVAHNTDSAAIADAISERFGSNPPESALVLGAGGSSRAAIHALGAIGVGSIGVLSRRPEQAEKLCAEFDCHLATQPPDGGILVNCTPVGLTGSAQEQLAALPISTASLAGLDLVCDLVYRSGGTALQERARDEGVRIVDGLEILVRQGARSVEIWTGQRPSLEPLVEAVADPA